MVFVFLNDRLLGTVFILLRNNKNLIYAEDADQNCNLECNFSSHISYVHFSRIIIVNNEIVNIRILFSIIFRPFTIMDCLMEKRRFKFPLGIEQYRTSIGLALKQLSHRRIKREQDGNFDCRTLRIGIRKIEYTCV